MRNIWKRKLSSLALLAILFGVNVGLLATPNAAYAQAPDVVAADAARDVVKTILGVLKDALGAGLLTGLVNVLVNQLNTFAYESAVWVASGGNAEDPLFDPRSAEDYLRDAGAQIASDMLDELGGMSIGDIATKYGVTLPDDPNLMAAIQNGVQSAFVPTVNHEDFNFNDIKDNWQGYLVSVTSDTAATAQEKTEAVLTTLAKSFDPGANELSSSMAVYGQVINEAQVKSKIQTDRFQQDDGFLSLTDAVGQYTETPASFVKEKIQSAIKKSEDGASEIGLQLLSNSEGLIQIGASAASIFTNTLVSELMNKMNKGLFADIATDYKSVNPFDSNAVVTSSRERAQERLKSLSTFKPITVTDFSLLSEFATCPANFRGVNRKLYNCVLDTSFTSAISQAESGAPETLAEAIENGYIDGNWPLIPSGDTARNQDQKCYTYGFCHSNLVKMRKARIIPIGWELAAESPNNSTSSPVTLQEVMDNFNSCNGDGELDSEFPWCHLIDPNWVIKYPETSCRTLAYGQLIQASGTDARSTECVDPQTCIAEDENGNCTGGWGYCVREQNTWNFRGDSCPEQYASCVSFTTEAGEAVDYLTSTVDYAGCTEDNAGCQWYATAKREVDDVWDWPGVNNEELAQTSASAPDYRIYLNSNVETCDAADAGCTQLVVRDTDTRLNLVTNPSFETDADGNSWPDSWMATDYSGVTYTSDNTEDRSGSAGVKANSGVFYQTGLTLSQSRFYTFSFYAKQGDVADTLRTGLFLFDETGEEDIDVTGYSYTGDCTPTDFDGDGNFEALVIDATPTSSTYERFECTFTTPALADTSKSLQAYIDFFDGDVWIDDVQLEQGGDASIFRDGYGVAALSDLTLAYAKMPPAYLGCTGASTDPVECDSYATMCTELDVGCELYTPLNGDPGVTGVTSDLDSCPSSCVGYETYKQEPTLYEPNGSFPEYFIPDTATECNAEAVGCDEFTNLTTEAKEYYTYLRACVTSTQAHTNSNSDREAVFYTWEGSDVSGFQLKTWHLLESDMSASPDSAAPCTNWVTTTAGISCNDDSDGNGTVDSVTTACDGHEDIFTEPDCREFYDADGTVHFRLWTDTVTVDDACVSYRKTDIAGDAVADKEANCTDSGGWFETDTNTCLYFGWSEESTACTAAVNGCREYTGGRSANSRQVYEELYEDNGLTMFEAADATSTTLSNESIATEGHSLLTTQNVWTYLYESSACATSSGCVSPDTSKLGASCTESLGSTSCGTLEGQLQTDKTYTLSFWAKGSGTIDVGFDIDADSSPEVDTSSSTTDAVFETDLNLSGEWQEYQVGPLNMTSADFPTFGDGTVLVFSPDSGATLYLDNVVLREGEQDITLIKNSWVTPAVCDQDINGNISDQYYLGCSEYLKTDGTSVNLHSFSKLCDEDKVGCTGYFQTANSDSESAAMYNAVCENVDADGNGTDQAAANIPCYLLTNSAGTAFDTASQELCTIHTGETSCQFDTDYLLSQVTIDGDSRLTHIVLAADTVVIPADHDLFAIVGVEDECDSASASCTEVGQVTYTADRSAVDSYTSVYLMNDPDSYGDILCARDEQFCQAFDGGSAGTYYFKDPTAQTCEYKTSVTVGSSTFDGWFRTGTNEFCYGTGSCSNSSTTSCTVDADCRIGACSDSSTTACYSDFDCNTGATCSISDDTATCQIEDGSYLVGGDYSSVWTNGDLNFANWTATCSAEFNGCSEFQDHLDIADNEFYGDTDGQSYFFLNNDNLDENTLITSQQCSGQVSNRLGCVLFNDTGLPGLDYNASATYIASVHADELFGDSSFDLVDPIDCDGGNSVITASDGTEVDLCAQRCVYDHGDLDVTDGSDASGKMMEESRDGSGGTTFGRDDIWDFSGSCYTDSDCPQMVSDTGDFVDGSCETSVRIDPAGINPGTDGEFADVPALENDTNRILKVNRDRQCSEWLTCSSSQTVWDESTGQYKTICDGIDLCTEYSALGDSSFCSSWNPDDPTVVLDSARYAERDVSWYGSEYSGYAVPDGFPVQRLSQVNIAGSGLCSILSDANDSGACDVDTDCLVDGATCEAVNEKDFRLAYDAGECSDGYGQDCVVGYCADTAAPCAASSDCEPDGGECIVGSCLEISATVCTDDSECTGDGETCMSGLCTADVGDCDLNYSCGTTGGTCFPSVAVKTGSCYRDRCIVAPNGDQFNNETAETQICRAWPEANSPFPTTVVSEWTKLGNILTTTDTFAKTSSVPDLTEPSLASTRFSGFDRANVCLPGEDCDCSYKKLSNGLGNSVYIDDASDADTIAGTLSDGGSSRLGICSAGTGMGAICTEDADCGATDSGAKCDSITKEDQIIGLQGYCLERDTGISILGQADLGACLTWFPVDQLTGSTDLNAKYKGAGFYDDVYMCTDSRPFIDLQTSEVSKTVGGMACVSIESGDCTKANMPDQMNTCADNVVCPDGYFGIVGACAFNDSIADGYYASACESFTEVGVNGCPYICVPDGSYHESGDDTDSACSPNSDNYSDTWEMSFGDLFIFNHQGGERGDVITEDDDASWYADFDEVVDQYKDCVNKGVQVDQSVFDIMQFPQDNSDSADTYRYLDMLQDDSADDFRIYPGCDEVTKVSTSDESYAWTDRIHVDGYAISASTDNVEYTNNVSTYPFGATSLIPTDFVSTDPPMRLAQCYSADDLLIIPPSATSDFTVCPTGYDPGNPTISSGVNPASDPHARTFIDFVLNYSHVYSLEELWTINPSADSQQSLFDSITQVFANIDFSTVYSWGGGISSDQEYDVITAVNDTYSSSDIDVRETGNPPTIWPLDVDNCFGQYCREGDANTGITVNDSNEGIQTGNGGFFRGTVKFYAAADKNQLPLRRVIVDWGDDYMSGSDDMDNFYKNHRGILPDSQTQTYCDVCDSTTDVSCEWGMTADSCDPNYFSYQHNYRCSDSDLVTMAACITDDGGNITNSPCSDGSACYYRPSVHVRDNWGWCSGMCTALSSVGDGTGSGCYDGDGNLTTQNQDLDECLYTYYPDNNPADDPWVYYDGQIVVTP